MRTVDGFIKLLEKRNDDRRSSAFNTQLDHDKYQQILAKHAECLDIAGEMQRYFDAKVEDDI